ncbi:response regulator [Geomonas agri]|uniref:response regulator n=1 Tax=Geomonas agri TaxID=2873702 RepID=UPI001CD48FE7|nr:response regulator [Geomonas agri]
MAEAARVLLVDDEPMFRRSLAGYLEDCGYCLAEAEDGQEAQQRLLQEQFDLVLTDMRMPVLDGMDLLAWIRERQPETPVIVITGTGAEQVEAAVLSLGAAAFLTKPIMDLRELECVMERVLKG